MPIRAQALNAARVAKRKAENARCSNESLNRRYADMWGLSWQQSVEHRAWVRCNRHGMSMVVRVRGAVMVLACGCKREAAQHTDEYSRRSLMLTGSTPRQK